MSAPPFPYFGGKQVLGPRIARMLPPHQHYVEPYCGSLAVLLAKSPSPMETVNDLDSDLMLFWQILRDYPDDLMRVCALTPHSRAEHQAAYHRDEVTDLERARRIWVLLSQGRGGQLQKTGWRHYADPYGGSGMPDYLRGYVGRIPDAAARLINVSLECKPALEIIDKFGRYPNVLLYVDPPYLGTTRSSGGYQVDMPTATDHRDLANVLVTCQSSVVLSGYPSALYDEMYSGWCRHEMPASTGQGGIWANRTEVLWSNRPLGAQPGLWDHLGGDVA
jgi:DNA adenine methylase